MNTGRRLTNYERFFSDSNRVSAMTISDVIKDHEKQYKVVRMYGELVFEGTYDEFTKWLDASSTWIYPKLR